MSAAPGCEAELTQAFICTQTELTCSCFDATTFTVAFEAATRESYFSALAFTAQSDPAFCEAANDSVCQYYDLNHSCCCKAETEAYRRCLVENIYPLELPQPVAPETAACENVCATNSANANAGGGGSTIMIVIIAVVVLLLGAVGFYCYRRRRANTGDEEKGSRRSFLPCFGSNKDSKKGKSDSKKGKSSKKKRKGLDLERGEVRVGPSSQSSSITDDADFSGSRSKRSSKKSSKKSSKRKSRKGKNYDDPYEDPSYVSEEEEDTPLQRETDDYESSKKLRAKKKRDIIEAWNRDRKHGSTRTLSEYLTDEGSDDIVPEERPRNKDRSSKRRSSSRHLDDEADDDEASFDVRESSRNSNKSRQNSSRDLKEKYSESRKSHHRASSAQRLQPNDRGINDCELRERPRRSKRTSGAVPDDDMQERARGRRSSFTEENDMDEVTGLILDLERENAELRRQLRQSISSTAELQQAMPPVEDKKEKKSSRSRSKSRSRDQRRSRSRSQGSLGRARSRSQSVGSLGRRKARKSDVQRSGYRPDDDTYERLSRSLNSLGDPWQSRDRDRGIYL